MVKKLCHWFELFQHIDNSLQIKIKGAHYLWAQWLLLATNSLNHFFFQEVDGDQSDASVCGYCDSKGKMLAILV